jgi:hypothetical protein
MIATTAAAISVGLVNVAAGRDERDALQLMLCRSRRPISREADRDLFCTG